MKINKVIIHAADTPAGMNVGVEEIRRWHVEGNGWSDIGYHYVITRDGTIEAGRDEDTQGAHVRGHNGDSLGVCMVGGKPGCNYTAAQWEALAWLVRGLLLRHGLVASDVYGHNDFDKGKTCPTFDAHAWAANLEI